MSSLSCDITDLFQNMSLPVPSKMFFQVGDQLVMTALEACGRAHLSCAGELWDSRPDPTRGHLPTSMSGTPKSPL